MTEISVEELNVKLQGDLSQLQLIDVREPQEIALASIAEFIALPLSKYQQWSSTIAVQFDPCCETLVLCHHGVRSEQMCHWLRSIGFTNVKNVIGGIDRYSLVVDPSIPRY